MAADIAGKTGRVSGEVAPGKTGEVIVSFGEGTDHFLAYPYDGKEIIAVNTRVLVMEYAAPRTVFVTALETIN